MIFLFQIYLKLNGLILRLVNSIIFWLIIVIFFNYKSNFVLKKVYLFFNINYLFNLELDLLFFRLFFCIIIYNTVLYFKKYKNSSNINYYEYINLLDLILGESRLIRAINLLLLITLNLYCTYFVIFFGLSFEIGYLESTCTLHIFLVFLIIFLINIFSIPSINLIRLYETHRGLKPIPVPIKYIRPNIFYVFESFLSVLRNGGAKLSRTLVEKPILKPSQEVLEKEITLLRQENQGLNRKNIELQDRLRSSHVNAIMSGGSLLIGVGGLFCAIQNNEHAAEQLKEARKLGTPNDPNIINKKIELEQQEVLIKHQKEIILLEKDKIKVQQEELKLTRQRSEEVLDTVNQLKKELEELKKTNKKKLVMVNCFFILYFYSIVIKKRSKKK